MAKKCGREERRGKFPYMAIEWEEPSGLWGLLTLAQSLEELDDRIDYWRSRCSGDIRVFALTEIEACTGDDRRCTECESPTGSDGYFMMDGNGFLCPTCYANRE
jgi:hypothetical protein